MCSDGTNTAEKLRVRDFLAALMIIKVFIKLKIMSVETILSAYTHTQASVYTSMLTMQSLIYTQLKTGSKKDLRRMNTAARNRKHSRSIVLGKEMLLGHA